MTEDLENDSYHQEETKEAFGNCWSFESKDICFRTEITKRVYIIAREDVRAHGKPP